MPGQLRLEFPGATYQRTREARKSTAWKLAVAAWLKARTQARTKWIAQALYLGAPSALSRINLTPSG